MSEAELTSARSDARVHGPKRAEVAATPVAGSFVYDAAGKVQSNPDRQVQEARENVVRDFGAPVQQGGARTLFERGALPVPPPHGPRMAIWWNELT